MFAIFSRTRAGDGMGRFGYSDIVVGSAALAGCLVQPALAQETRQDEIATQQAEKATRVQQYEPDTLERRLALVEKVLSSEQPFYPYIGKVMEGGGLAMGPGYRAQFGDSGSVTAHAAWSLKNYKGAQMALTAPAMIGGRVTFGAQLQAVDAPDVAFYGIGNDTLAGGNEADLLFGEDGDDSLLGGNGEDQLAAGQRHMSEPLAGEAMVESEPLAGEAMVESEPLQALVVSSSFTR